MATKHLARVRRVRPVNPLPIDPALIPYVVETGAGERREFGRGSPAFVVHVPDWAYWARLAARDPFHAGLAFVRGEFDVTGDLVAAIRARQETAAPRSFGFLVGSLLTRLRLEHVSQSRARARRNVEFHYDRSNAFYRAFLDARLVYSCAYFREPTDTLDVAQTAKLNHICRKLRLGSDDTFLDIGCGWGALVVQAAGTYHARALGCTLSAAQHAYATRLLDASGLSHRARIERWDYRDVPGTFSKIASVGMVEHVGRRRLPGYFSAVAARLAPDGLFLNHGIIRPRGSHPDAGTHFLQQRVFPGSELPHLDEMVAAAEGAGFEVLDVEDLRSHYALTCRAWVARLQANAEACLRAVDEETYRTWRMYLAASAANFELGGAGVCQMLLARRPATSHPLTREYMYGPRREP